MVRRLVGLVVLATAVLLSGCASSRESPPGSGDAARISPAELFASLADVAQGRNADLAETGLVLKRIEIKVVVGHDRRAGGRASFLVLDAESSRQSETSFTATFTFELPPAERRKSATAPVALPAVAEFVDAAIATARELVAAAERAELPQRISGVELTARIVRSQRSEGGVAFRGLGSAALGGGVSRGSEEANTVKLVFGRR